MKDWLKDLPTQPLHVVVGLALAAVFVLACLVADMIGHPVSQGTQGTMGLFIASIVGVEAARFAAKRATDSGYAAAKQGTAPTSTTVVSESAATTVTVEPAP